MIIVVVIPTYNEAGNVEKLVRLVEKEIQSITDHQINLLIVDGNSPDGTALIIKKLQQEFSNIHIVVEDSKQGLGAAYISGMLYAMERLRADSVVEMDADFQHDPADLRRFIIQIDAGADYVIGSRFISGGSIPKDWSLRRKLLSVVGNMVSRILLSLPNITDYTSGFKASRVRGFLDQIDLQSLASRGFAYKIDLLSRMVDLGAKVKEIPIAFANREEGVSKMEGNNPLDSLRVIVGIRLKKSYRLLKFLTVGFLGLVLNFIGYRVFVEIFKWHPALANFVGAEAAVISNFYFNNRWTFADRRHTILKEYVVKFIHFNLTSALGIVFIQSGIIWLLTSLWGKEKNIFSFFLATSFLVIYNFTVYSRVIWKSKK